MRATLLCCVLLLAGCLPVNSFRGAGAGVLPAQHGRMVVGGGWSHDRVTFPPEDHSSTELVLDFFEFHDHIPVPVEVAMLTGATLPGVLDAFGDRWEATSLEDERVRNIPYAVLSFHTGVGHGFEVEAGMQNLSTHVIARYQLLGGTADGIENPFRLSTEVGVHPLALLGRMYEGHAGINASYRFRDWEPYCSYRYHLGRGPDRDPEFNRASSFDHHQVILGVDLGDDALLRSVELYAGERPPWALFDDSQRHRTVGLNFAFNTGIAPSPP